MSELEKFKRRMVRSVARLLLHEKRPEDEVWDALRKESGCDCKLLWQRMRALTIKKLERLLAVDDQPEQIAAVARLSPTDWLLCDLVLVHEDVDLIGKKQRKDRQCLSELFSLVVTYQIEDLAASAQGDGGGQGGRGEGDGAQRLAHAWTTVTAHYNQPRQKGLRRQCSAMLMQRRWYQLKEATRDSFYRLWTSYRGNPRLWEKVKDSRPTALQKAIAKRFPHVITQSFRDWEQMIEAGLVILPKEFEERVRNPPKATQTNPNEKDPDLVMLEPEIETIELDSDTDDERQTSNPGGSKTGHNPEDDYSNPASNESAGLQYYDDFENDPGQSDGLSNVKILEATHIPIQDITDGQTVKIKVEAEDPSDPAVKRRNLSIEMSKYLESTRGEVDSPDLSIEDTTGTQDEGMAQQATTDDIIKQKADQLSTKFKVANVNSRATGSNDNEPAVEDDTEDALIKQIADAYVNKSNRTMSIVREEQISDKEAPSYSGKTDTLLPKRKACKENIASTNYDDAQDTDDFIKSKAYKCARKSKQDCSVKETNEPVVVEEKTSSDEDFYDDIIKQKAEAFIRQTEIKKLVTGVEKEYKASNAVENEEKTPEIKSECEPSTGEDLLEGMEIVDDGIEYVEEDEEEYRTHVKTESDRREKEEDTNAPFDIKLLMEPVVYTLKLDQMKIFSRTPFGSIKGSDGIAKALKESKPVSPRAFKGIHSNSDQPTQSKVNNRIGNEPPDKDVACLDESSEKIHRNLSDDEDSDQSEISEEVKVKPTSYLLQKPRRRSYNPIQLCKNPDFNTRLKRLTVGFFTSTRNRQLLKACKPMTIDLHKAFEPKLLNGTLYLKPSNESSQKQDQIQNQDKQTQNTTVMPSAMSIQSLIDHTIVNYTDKESPESEHTVDLTKSQGERNKVINLRNINEIRRINQKLLTAQVAPIRTQAEDNAISQTNLEAFSEDSALQIDERTKKVPVGEPNETETSEPDPPQKKRYVYKPQHLLNVTIGPQLNFKSSVPWNKPVNKTLKMDEFLITLDTLNKILNKMEGTEDKLSKKKKNWVVPRPAKVKAKAGSKPNENPEPKSGEAEGSPRMWWSLKRPDKSAEQLVPQYCCWAREKLIKLDSNKRVYREHKCKYLCECCCRTELASVLAQAYKRASTPAKKKALLLTYPLLAAAVCGDPSPDEQLANACKAIEEVVQQTHNVPTPVVRVMTVGDSPYTRYTNNKSQLVPIPGNTVENVVRGLPMEVAEVTSNSEPRDTPVSVTSRETSTRLVLNDPPEHFYIIRPENHRHIYRMDKTTQTYDEDQPAETYDEPTAPAVPTEPAVPTSPRSAFRTPPIFSKSVNNQKQLVIDGSLLSSQPKARQRHVKPSQVIKDFRERLVYLSSKNIAKEPTNNPIYLGKNKILLTTVKFPKKDGPVPQVTTNAAVDLNNLNGSVIQGTLELPAGVQLVLPTSGELTYVLEPGVALTAQQLDSLAQIIDVVKKQIVTASTKAQTVSDEVIRLSDDEDAPSENPDSSTAPGTSNTMNAQSNEPTQTTETQADAIDASRSEPSDNATMEDEGGPTESASTASEPTGTVEAADLNTSNASEVVTFEETTDETTPNNEHPKEAGEESRNLLMDLMEMSGISAEDTKQPQEVAPTPTLGAPLVTINHPPPLAALKSSLPELSPVTSLAELRYACEQNGKFFKLDFTTGSLVPINVCIKKNQKVQNPCFYVSTPKSIIDLTDDGDTTEDKKKNAPKKYQLPPNIFTGWAPKLKPAILARGTTGQKPPPVIVSHMARKRKATEEENTSKPQGVSRRPGRPRKDDLSRVEARIDMVDSDAPLEEEYLLDSDPEERGEAMANVNKSPIKVSSNRSLLKPLVEQANRNADEEDDSSDDEPLSTMIKRIRCGPPTIVEGSLKQVTANLNQGGDENVSMTGSPEMMLEQNEFEPPVENEEDEEDCILGF